MAMAPQMGMSGMGAMLSALQTAPDKKPDMSKYFDYWSRDGLGHAIVPGLDSDYSWGYPEWAHWLGTVKQTYNCLTIKVRGGDPIRDFGNKMSTPGEDEQSIALMVAQAKARGWSPLKAQGSEKFRRLVWEEAQRQGLEVQGYLPKTGDSATMKVRFEADHIERDVRSLETSLKVYGGNAEAVAAIRQAMLGLVKKLEGNTEVAASFEERYADHAAMLEKDFGYQPLTPQTAKDAPAGEPAGEDAAAAAEASRDPRQQPLENRLLPADGHDLTLEEQLAADAADLNTRRSLFVRDPAETPAATLLRDHNKAAMVQQGQAHETEVVSVVDGGQHPGEPMFLAARAPEGKDLGDYAILRVDPMKLIAQGHAFVGADPAGNAEADAYAGQVADTRNHPGAGPATMPVLGVTEENGTPKPVFAAEDQTRLMALRAMGVTEIPVLVPHNQAAALHALYGVEDVLPIPLDGVNRKDPAKSLVLDGDVARQALERAVGWSDAERKKVADGLAMTGMTKPSETTVTPTPTPDPQPAPVPAKAKTVVVEELDGLLAEEPSVPKR